MTYQETLDYLYNSLPMFHRIGEAALKPSLDNTLALCKLAGDPQYTFKSVHIAGTNGKGSTSHMIASILQEAGYKTGLFTSPHLKNFTERSRINGKEISREEIMQFVQKFKKDFERIQPSFFEMTVALSFDHFAREKVDIAVVEVGLGGRLDSTNIITPLVSLITNISFDHVNILGDTLKKIASEKAGIIKKNIPVVLSEYQEEIDEVFSLKAKSEQAPLIHASKEFSVLNARTESGRFICNVYRSGDLLYKDLVLDLPGMYQKQNLPGVLSLIYQLRGKGFDITEEHIRKGLSKVISNTGLKGRWQVLNQKPYTVCDTGHNEAGISQVAEQLRSIKYNKLHFVLGTVNDKSIDKILLLLPKEGIYYFTRPNIPRGLDATLLAEQARSIGLCGEVYPTVQSAVNAAKANASDDDMIFIGGSNFVVAEIEEL